MWLASSAPAITEYILLLLILFGFTEIAIVHTSNSESPIGRYPMNGIGLQLNTEHYVETPTDVIVF